MRIFFSAPATLPRRLSSFLSPREVSSIFSRYSSNGIISSYGGECFPASDFSTEMTIGVWIKTFDANIKMMTISWYCSAADIRDVLMNFKEGKDWLETWLAVFIIGTLLARVPFTFSLCRLKSNGRENECFMNLGENNYFVIESWGVVIADKIWGQRGG